ncbi:4703_t:CDS:2 [Acaulospora colombiana]|uniref:4703_t:CDS:1 n=1 Tax=Acaulospora colombiana TaxID=27376 RepID=A0ACA9KCT3_9GLOM|nr:4703_t:CDS:2 [Acaulospora colombiana]
MIEIRNILLIGSSGKGKSTVANVLTGTNEFYETPDRIRGTDNAKAEEFEHEGIKYRVTDTIGIGDPIRSTGEILSKLEDKADIISEGLNQILFVTNNRFTKEEVEAYELLRKAIFDDQVADYTTIVCTNFPEFKEEELCQRDRQKFREEIAKLSIPLALTAIIYVDNPPSKGLYKSISKISRDASRKVLLEYLTSRQKVYRPELLAKFKIMVDEFNLILEDTNKAINNFDFYNNAKCLREFICEREKIIKIIEARREEVKESMKARFSNNTLGNSAILGAGGLLGVASSDSAAIIKESEAYKLFEETLEKDKERRGELEKSQVGLRESIKELEKIHLRFTNSEYRKKNVDRKRIEIIENVLKRILGEEIEIDMSLTSDEKLNILLDHKEVESRTSLVDMEKVIKNWGEELEALRGKEKLLYDEYEKIKWCKEEMAKLNNEQNTEEEVQAKHQLNVENANAL